MRFLRFKLEAHALDPLIDLFGRRPDLSGKPSKVAEVQRRQRSEQVIARLGLDGGFEDVFDIHAAKFVPKPERAAYEGFMGAHAVAATSAAMPALRCTTVPPAKSMIPILPSQPSPHTQCAIGA